MAILINDIVFVRISLCLNDRDVQILETNSGNKDGVRTLDISCRMYTISMISALVFGDKLISW